MPLVKCGLFFDKAHAKKDEKIVWRITGTGKQFDARAQHEDGTIRRGYAAELNLLKVLRLAACRRERLVGPLR